MRRSVLILLIRFAAVKWDFIVEFAFSFAPPKEIAVPGCRIFRGHVHVVTSIRENSSCRFLGGGRSHLPNPERSSHLQTRLFSRSISPVSARFYKLICPETHYTISINSKTTYLLRKPILPFTHRLYNKLHIPNRQ